MDLALDLNRMTDEQLLDLRFSDLHLAIEGTPLERRVARLHKELEARGITFRPHVWLSEEWFTPDGVPGFAIPFYLAHPRLTRLERRQMLEVEGGSERECLRIMRHETGHALDNAYRLHSTRDYRKLFGSFSRRYPDFYKPVPNSRDYVLHLSAWYAQAHPAEDFAETFAVWLARGSRWRRRYQGWAALRKLEYVDTLMKKIGGARPPNESRRKVETLEKIRTTLREHYRRKRAHYAFEWPASYDSDLRRMFSNDPQHESSPSATSLLRRIRGDVGQAVAEGTGVHTYAVDQLIKQMMDRTTELKLRLVSPPEITKQKVLVMLTVQTMNVVQTGYHRIAL
ncbi:MAG TPA: putative zinc-binding metallopeptidase [Blastocatellia bacterium]|nr:putative zinc-binding metallopeptidase [Blastocatellia bacterium]